MVFVKLTIFVLVPLEGVGFDFFRPFDKVFILNLHEHLSNRGVKGRQHKVKSMRWSMRMSVVSPSSDISI